MTRVLRHRRALAAVLLSAGLAAAAAGCGGGGGGSSLPKGIAATVDGQSITVSAVNTVIADAKTTAKAQKQTFPKEGTDAYDQIVQQSVKLLVQKVELEQQVKKAGITITTKQVDTRLKALIKQYFGGSQAKYLAEIKKRGVTDAQVKDDVRLQLEQTTLIKKITAGAKVDEAEAHDYYLQHAPDYATPQSREVAHILVTTKTLAEKLYAQIQNGADFAALAKKNSTDKVTAAKGGNFTATLGADDPAFDKAAFALKTGEVSKPVKSQYGWHVIKALANAKPRQVIPFDKVKASITQQLLQSKQTEVATKWAQTIQTYYSTRVEYAKAYAPPATTATTQTTSIIPTAPVPGG